MSTPHMYIVDAATAVDMMQVSAPPWPVLISITDTPADGRVSTQRAMKRLLARRTDAHAWFAEFDDVPFATNGYVPVSAFQAQELVAFARLPVVRRASSVVVHCAAGISRSPAAAVVVFAAWGLSPVAAVGAMREAVRYTKARGFRDDDGVLPQPSVVVRGDEALGLDGGLVAAVMEAYPQLVGKFGRVR